MARLFAPSSSQTVRTLTASGTIVIPAGVTKLDSIVGYGAMGADAYTSGGVTTPGAKIITYTDVYTRKDGTTNPDIDVVTSYGTWSGTQPANTHTTTYIGDTSTVYNFRDSYVTYTQDPDTTTPIVDHPTTTGASATGFGLTFPGSFGAVAQTSVLFVNVTVAPGSHSITVPSGGFITATWSS